MAIDGGAEFSGSAAIAFDELADIGHDDACVQVWNNLGTGDVNDLSDVVHFGDVCFDEGTGLTLENLPGAASAEVVGDVALFTYAIEIGAASGPTEASIESVVRTCEPDDREFTNRAKIRSSDGSYVFDEWTITIEEEDDCDPPI